LLDDFKAGANALDIEVNGLLAEDRLLGAGGALDEIGVGVGWRADGDRVDVLGGEDAAAAAGSASATKATSLSERAATLPPWIFPILPAPIIPNFMRSSSQAPIHPQRAQKKRIYVPY
jgi:hypothetical protein